MPKMSAADFTTALGALELVTDDLEEELWSVHTRLTGSYSHRKAQYDDIDLLKKIADDVRALRTAGQALRAAASRRDQP